MTAYASYFVPVFFTVWGIGLIAFGVFFHFSKDVALKRRVYPIVVIAFSILFLIFAGVGMFQKGRLYVWPFIAVAVAAMMFVNLRSVRFCERCATMVQPRAKIWPKEECPKCRAKLG